MRTPASLTVPARGATTFSSAIIANATTTIVFPGANTKGLWIRTLVGFEATTGDYITLWADTVAPTSHLVTHVAAFKVAMWKWRTAIDVPPLPFLVPAGLGLYANATGVNNGLFMSYDLIA